jgi:hypothetical protein
MGGDRRKTRKTVNGGADEHKEAPGESGFNHTSVARGFSAVGERSQTPQNRRGPEDCALTQGLSQLLSSSKGHKDACSGHREGHPGSTPTFK